VSALVKLDDGRRLEFDRDLGSTFSSSVVDADFGRDCSEDLIFEGSPDGSRLLGLDRTAFRRTALVRQTEIGTVLDDPRSLQEYLQRAAANAGSDSTAASALQHLQNFSRDYVGLDRANSRKPLRAAMTRVEEARLDLENAQQLHGDHLEQIERNEALERQFSEASRTLRCADAKWAAAQATELEQQAKKCEELAVSSSVGESIPVAARSSTPRELDDLANDLSLQEPLLDPSLEREYVEAKALVDRLEGHVPAGDHRTTGTKSSLIGSVITAVAAIIKSLLRWLLPWQRRGDEREATIKADAYRKLREVEQARGEIHFDLKSVNDTRQKAASMIRELGLPEDADALRTLARRVRESDEAKRDLRSILAGRTLADITDEAERRRHRAKGLLSGVTEAELDKVDLGVDAEETLRELRLLEQQASSARDTAAGSLSTSQEALPSVTEAEEESVAAEGELARVQQLEATLKHTISFLEEAQDHVHRSIVPALREGLVPWLERVTEGSYVDARIDVDSLELTVREKTGQWREAFALSQGTFEQIYLLLRVAMASHLARADESCPLILDDVTVACDRSRTYSILDLLLELSADRQIIFFSQEDEVLEWARAHLTSPQDQLTELTRRW
jgi:uncharacterized protein YhaN